MLSGTVYAVELSASEVGVERLLQHHHPGRDQQYAGNQRQSIHAGEDIGSERQGDDIEDDALELSDAMMLKYGSDHSQQAEALCLKDLMVDEGAGP